MDLSRWQVFSNLSPNFLGEVRLAYTWGSAKGGYLVTTNDDVYCIGEHKSRERKCKLLSPKKIDALCGKGIKSFHYGQSQTLALTNSGQLYQWNICYEIEPTVVTGFVPQNVTISQVAVGELHMLASTSEGKVFSWGGNAYGQLGIGTTLQNHQPQLVYLHSNRIVAVACSQGASFALTDDGDILSWGRGKQNGRSNSDLTDPGILLRSKSVSQILCGQHQGLGLTKDGKLYCWGIEEGTRRASPREICRESGPIVKMGGSFHNEFFVCQTASQEVFVWGRWFGQSLKDPFKTKYQSVDEAFASYYVPTMCRTLTVQRPSVGLLKSFDSALNDEETADVEFVVEGNKIFAHRVFLKFRVPYFRTMFEKRWTDSNQRVIQVDKFTHDVFMAFITYVYTERVDVKAYTDLYGLFEAADYYSVQELSEKCENLLKRGMHEGNVCTIYGLAVRHNAKNLQSYTREYIVPRFSKVVESKDFEEMDPVISNQLIRELAHKRKLVDEASDGSSVGKKARRDMTDNQNESGALQRLRRTIEHLQNIQDDEATSDDDSVVDSSDSSDSSEGSSEDQD